MYVYTHTFSRLLYTYVTNQVALDLIHTTRIIIYLPTLGRIPMAISQAMVSHWRLVTCTHTCASFKHCTCAQAKKT
jgi:hypothetical protein